MRSSINNSQILAPNMIKSFQYIPPANKHSGGKLVVIYMAFNAQGFLTQVRHCYPCTAAQYKGFITLRKVFLTHATASFFIKQDDAIDLFLDGFLGDLEAKKMNPKEFRV